MKIWITYEVPTANGFWHQHITTAASFEEANDICERIEGLGYLLKDVTRDVYED